MTIKTMRLNLKAPLAVAMSLVMTDVVIAADWSLSGFVRQEVAVKTGSDQNINNWAGNPYNGVAATNTGLGAGINPTLTRPAAQREDVDFNLFATRLELDLDGQLNDNWAAHIKLRAFTDQVGELEDAFDDINHYEQEFNGPFESASSDALVDLPEFYLDYNKGPLWIRIGNQQIAWGEALFFRVADVANGLDLRRHSAFDVAAEEYSDKRVSALGLRGSYRFSESSELEGFVQRFRPTVLPGENSPYNVIPAQFVVQQDIGFDESEDDVNFGLRFRKTFDSGLEAQVFASRRTDPNGVFAWTEARGPGAVAGTAFEAGSGNGVYSSEEWFHYASSVRLDGITALNTALNEFSATTGLGAPAVAGACGANNATAGSISNNSSSAGCVLDTFFDPTVGLGNLRGHLSRKYMRENVFGFGFNYVFEGEPDTLLDQLIARFELSYTPDKIFTAPSLSQDYIEADETQFAFIFEKYHKFSAEVPATYMVLQWLHKSESDLFGRHLSGNNNKPGSRAKGADNFNAVAFALQQPSKTLEWRYDLAVLTDFEGGWLIQPGVRWRPRNEFQLDLYANVLESDGGGDDFADGLDYADEVFARISYFF